MVSEHSNNHQKVSKFKKTKNAKTNQNKAETKKMSKNQSSRFIGLGYRNQNPDIFSKALNSRNTGRAGTKCLHNMPNTSSAQNQMFSSFKHDDENTTLRKQRDPLRHQADAN